jgi:hypothetical protein
MVTFVWRRVLGREFSVLALNIDVEFLNNLGGIVHIPTGET